MDCIYSVEAAQEAQLNPMRDIKRALEAAKEQDIEADCPECFSNQLQWYCASLLPKCGTVRVSVANGPLLSIIAEVPCPPTPPLITCVTSVKSHTAWHFCQIDVEPT